MEVGNFAVAILTEDNGFSSRRPAAEQAIGGNDGYVVLPAREGGVRCHIELRNNFSQRCNAYLMLDNKPIDTFRLRPGQIWAIETNPKSPTKGIFTLYPSVAHQGLASEVAAEDRGVVKVRFVPEIPRFELGAAKGITERGGSRGGDFESYGTRGGTFSGGTTRGGSKGLGSGFFAESGSSDQRFGSASHIVEDTSSAVTITLRCVVEFPTPAIDDRTPRRLGNQTPPPIAFD